MKTINKFLLAILAFGVTSITVLQAQEVDDQPYLILSYNHFNMDNEDLSEERWLELEKEYRSKVLNNNEYIRNFFTFSHRLTADNSEVIHGMIIRGWDNIKKMQDTNAELIQKTWPESEEQQAFFNELNSYYTPDHSDEIYYALPYHAKDLPEGDIVVHFRMNHTKSVMGNADANKEFQAIQSWFIEDILPNNEHVIGYFPYTHAWGSSATDFLEIWIYPSMEDLEKSAERSNELVKASKTEEELKAMGEIGKKFFSPKHEDYIYSRHAELSKRSFNKEESK